MITSNSYQDIQILQDADFENVITFDAATYDVDDYNYKAIIAKDRKATTFTYNGNPNTTYVGFTITKNSNGTTSQSITLKLTAAQTSKFEDDFEGVWDLIVQDDSTPSSFVREFEGDVVVSPSVSTTTNHEFTS
jgi:hypothetical protein